MKLWIKITLCACTVFIVGFVLFVFVVSTLPSKRVDLADFSRWNQDSLPPLLQDLPDAVSAEVVPIDDQKSWIKITYTGVETVSIPIFEKMFPIHPFNIQGNEFLNSDIYSTALMKVEDVHNKAYFEMLCFINETPYFSRALNDSLTGTQEKWVTTPFYLQGKEVPEKIQLGIRIEGPGTVWIREVQLMKTYKSIFSAFSTNQYGWLGAFLGVMGGLYGCTAGYCVPRGKGKAFLNGLGYFIIMFCAVSLVLGILALASGEQYGIWYSLLHTGFLGLVIFIPGHFVTLRNYQKMELQRMKAMDSLDSVS